LKADSVPSQFLWSKEVKPGAIARKQRAACRHTMARNNGDVVAESEMMENGIECAEEVLFGKFAIHSLM
jgi:hypothetical protein